MKENVKLALEDIIKYRFPKIRGLKIQEESELGVTVSYDYKSCDKEELERFIRTTLKEKLQLQFPKSFTKTDFGFIPNLIK